MQALALADETQNVFQRAIEAAITIGPYQLHWLELIGVLIGLASAYLGMRRWVWAWPVGIIANVMLFFVYLGAVFGADERIPLFGQAGRQVFFIVTSIYGWWRWSRLRRLNHADDPIGCRDHAALGHDAGAHRGRRLLARRHRRRAPGLRLALEPLAEPLLHPAVVVLLVRRVDLRRARSSRPTRWLAGGTSSGSPGSGSTSSASPSASPRATCRRPCSTRSTASSSSTASPSGSRPRAWSGLTRRTALARSATG